ncbi:MAG: endonuclease/exonuclease/phosphatase family protein [Candidatus Hydrogenedentota bacterium]
MVEPRKDSSPVKLALLSAFFFLFFVQLLTIWIESIYRLSLIKLNPGKEMLGLLFVLSPMALLLAGRGAQRWLCVGSLFTMFLARALCPLFGGAGLIIVAGAGVGASLITMCCLPTHISRIPQRSLGLGLAIAVLMSVALRAWGSSFDISMGKPGDVLAWALVACAAFLLRGSATAPINSEPTVTTPFPERLARSMLLFSSLAMVYLVLSSPAVVTTWSGSNYVVGLVLLVLSLTAAAAWLAAGLPSPVSLGRRILTLWNALFVTALLVGILLHTVEFPSSPDDPTLVVHPTTWPYHMPFYLMFVLSPVLVFNIIAAVENAPATSPRAHVFPVLVGMIFLTAITLVLIFTNTWGYLGAFGHFLRNRFYLPFLLVGAGMIIPLLLPVWHPSFPLRKNKLPAIPVLSAALVVGLFAIGGAAYRSAGPPQAPDDPETLTVLTYNMQQATDTQGYRNLHGQLDLLRKVNADIIGLQESDGARPSLGNVDATRFFADTLGYHVYFGPNAISGTYGTAILSRFPLENPRTLFTYSTIDEVGTAVAEIEAGGRRIGLFNSHPAGPQEVKMAHAEALVKECAQYDYVITMGDHNTRPDSPAYAVVAEILSETWLQKYPDGTGQAHPLWPESTPENRDYDISTRRIDYIFASPNFEIVESFYVLSPESETDHPAHWSVLRWKE